MGQFVDAEDWMFLPDGYKRKKYRAYVPHRLAGWSPVLSPSAVGAISNAGQALTGIRSLPHSGFGGAVMSWMQAREESIRSSLIEGVEATESGLAWARYMDATGRPVTDQNQALTLGAAKQVSIAVALGKNMANGVPCSMDDLLALQNALFANTRDRDLGGAFRSGPIWVGPPGCTVDGATYVAPPAELVPELMDDLLTYINSSDHPPVLRAAITHAQFETIHPFDDGNGRTGRALVHTIFNSTGVSDGAVPVSTSLEREMHRYYGALKGIQGLECKEADDVARSTAYDNWLGVFSDACVSAHTQAVLAGQTAERVTERWKTSSSFRRDSTAAKLLEVLPTMPVLDAGMVSQRLGVTERSARSALSSLARSGIIESTGAGRNKRYVVPDMVDVLRSTSPDGGSALPVFAQTGLLGGNLINSPPRLCGYRGPRSRKRCILPQGHGGQHRYEQPRRRRG